MSALQSMAHGSLQLLEIVFAIEIIY